MKKMVMAMAALGILAGGGAGAYFFLMKKPAEASIQENGKAEDHAKADKGHGEGGKDGHGEKGPTFVKLDPLVVPIIDAEGVSQVISMVVQFEVSDEESAKKVEALRPRIKDAFIQNMYGLMNSNAALDRGVVKVGYVKKRMNEISAKVFGEGVVDDVLIQMVQQNPI